HSPRSASSACRHRLTRASASCAAPFLPPPPLPPLPLPPPLLALPVLAVSGAARRWISSNFARLRAALAPSAAAERRLLRRSSSTLRAWAPALRRSCSAAAMACSERSILPSALSPPPVSSTISCATGTPPLSRSYHSRLPRAAPVQFLLSARSPVPWALPLSPGIVTEAFPGRLPFSSCFPRGFLCHGHSSSL